MRSFENIGGFLRYMERSNARMADAGLDGLARAAKMIKIEAKTEIGHYQSADYPFVGWAELADATKDERVKLGYSENDPGLRSGEMQESIESAANYNVGVVGSDSEKLVWFEMGTTHQPPRSVLGLAALHKTDQAVDAVAGRIAGALAGVSGLLPKD